MPGEKVKSKRGVASPDYSVRIVHQTKRVRFPLQTSNKEAAASKAAKIFTFLVENGWEETLAQFKPGAASKKSTEVEPQKKDTIGDLIEVNQTYSSARPKTQHAYVKALRRIASGVMELEEVKSFKSREDFGNDTWREQIDAIPLSELTPERIQNWKQHYLSQHSKTAISKKQATTTVNSLIRNSKALFIRYIF